MQTSKKGAGAGGGDLTKRTVAGVFWQFFGTGSEAFLKILVLIVLARVLTPDDFGLATAATIVVGLLPFSQFGVGHYIVQRSELPDDHIRTGFGFAIFAGTASCAIIYVAAPFISSLMRMPGLTPLIQATALCFPLTAPGVVAEALLSRDMKFKLLAGTSLISFTLGYGIVGITLGLLGFGVWALVLAQLAQLALKALVLLYLRPHPKGLWTSSATLGPILHFGAGFSLAQLGNFAATNVDNFVVGRWMGPTALGLYGRAYQFLVLPANLLGTVIDRVLFPAMASVQYEQDRLARAFTRAVGIIAAVFVPASGILVILAPEVISVFLGSQWAEVVVPFQVLALSLPFRTGYKMSDTLARATGAVYRRAWRQWIYASAVFTGALLGTYWGLPGTAAGVGGAILLNFLLMMHLSLKLTGATWSAIGLIHLRHFLCLAPILFPCWLVAYVSRACGAPDIVTLVLSAVAGGLPFFAMLFRFTRLLGDEGQWLKQLMQEQGGKRLRWLRKR